MANYVTNRQQEAEQLKEQLEEQLEERLKDQLLDVLTFNQEGLIPAIIQDIQSKAVLMMGYMSRESLQKTVETGETWFWSRSRKELWHKGATSGNVQEVHTISYDCDADTLLILVSPKGPACHNGTYTCFEQKLAVNKKASEKDEENGSNVSSGGFNIESEAKNCAGFDYAVLSQLIETIAKREKERPDGAYTTYLFEKGVDKILKKVGEEASEVIIAAKNRDANELSLETADLLYHLLVLLQEQTVSLDQVLTVLEERHK